jgi:hypothetical protein
MGIRVSGGHLLVGRAGRVRATVGCPLSRVGRAPVSGPRLLSPRAARIPATLHLAWRIPARRGPLSSRRRAQHSRRRRQAPGRPSRPAPERRRPHRDPSPARAGRSGIEQRPWRLLQLMWRSARPPLPQRWGTARVRLPRLPRTPRRPPTSAPRATRSLPSRRRRSLRPPSRPRRALPVLRTPPTQPRRWTPQQAAHPEQVDRLHNPA